jgi:two-component system, OmpR family, phosphate regulon sensor histidine kinase PhoR
MTRGRSVFLAQLPLTGATALITFGIALFAPELFRSSAFVLGVVIVFGVTGLCLIIPWSRIRVGWIVALPVLDIAAIALMRAGNHDVQLSVLLILPTIWLASAFRLPGAIIAFVLGVGAVWAPTIGESADLTLENASPLLLVPLLLAFVAVMVAATSTRASAQQNMLIRQGQLVEEALESSKRDRRVLRGIVDAVDFGIIGLELDGTLSLTNRRSAALLGETTGRSAGDPRVAQPGAPSGAPRVARPGTPHVEPVFYAADRTTRVQPDHDPVARALAGETFDREVLWTGEPGTDQAALAVSAQQVVTDTGQRTGAVVVFRDVTVEVQAQRAKEELISAVSHELRTPLTSVIGYLELALDTPGLPEQARSYTHTAADSADRMLQLISDMLVAASSEEGKLTVARREADLGQIVVDAIDALAPRARARDARVLSDVTAGEYAFIDPVRIRQVIDNVLSNALKYGRQSGTITVAAVRTNDQLVLSIADDGTGISEADQHHLFDRFYRGSAVRGGPITGTGLGLSISRAIMREHGGDIRIASELGVGTTVSIILPVEAAPNPSAKEPS